MEKKKRSNAGRKRTIIDWSLVDSMIRELFGTLEICQALNISFHALQDGCRYAHKMDFATYRHTVASSTLRKLANAQLKVAFGFNYEVSISSEKTVGKTKVTTKTTKVMGVPPDTKMLIHLGQQFLNQKPIAPDRKEGTGPHNIAGYVIEDEAGNVIDDQTEQTNDDGTNTQEDA